MIRRATAEDIPAVAGIYRRILERETVGQPGTGWKPGIYPTQTTAEDALRKNELFVMELDGKIVASARINQEQAPAYKRCQWRYPAPEDRIMVLHTLVVDPSAAGQGCGKEFVRFYEAYASGRGCTCLRMDTNEINTGARGLYKKLGYREAGIVPCVFEGIEGMNLVCLEKQLDSGKETV